MESPELGLDELSSWLPDWNVIARTMRALQFLTTDKGSNTNFFQKNILNQLDCTYLQCANWTYRSTLL